MRYNKLIAATLVALFILGSVAPAVAGDGRPPKFADISIQDHPWQDDNNKDGGQGFAQAVPYRVRPLGHKYWGLAFNRKQAVNNCGARSQTGS